MKLKITFLTLTGILPFSIIGPAVFLTYLSSSLRKLGVSVNVFDFSVRNFRRGFFSLFQVIKHIITGNVVVFNSRPIGPLLFFLFLAKILRKKTVVIFHGGKFFEFKSPLHKINAMIFLSILKSKIVEYTIVPSQWTLKDLQKLQVRSKLLKIPNGVAIDEIDSIPATRLSTKNNICFVGRVTEMKGISTLLDACSLLNSEKFDYNLYIAGPQVRARALSQNKIDTTKKVPNVYFLGQISHGKVISLIKGADILVLPSLMESFSLAVLEGMACGTPVIATSVGGIPELIDKPGFNGILVPPSDPRILADVIKDLLNNSDKRAKLSENGYKTVRNKYKLEKVSLMYLKFLKTIAK